MQAVVQALVQQKWVFWCNNFYTIEAFWCKETARNILIINALFLRTEVLHHSTIFFPGSSFMPAAFISSISLQWCVKFAHKVARHHPAPDNRPHTKVEIQKVPHKVTNLEVKITPNHMAVWSALVNSARDFLLLFLRQCPANREIQTHQCATFNEDSEEGSVPRLNSR